ncbi:DUF547 domain-containing protein [Amphiplicatus metriothermophilus]|uniref:DUF547 domain-containing protein n=1 Tax=Amphiplicatus metriothermophilus TaxID=1519374 RepID=UPI00135BED4B|nr:DUF547 domain-containing protein [Amphiplicatus metriothermophilus]MBB5517562.1 hypothetical protein [Amphiplicatus metriothermophilus]
MSRLLLSLLAVGGVLLSQTLAAPMWIERQFLRAAELIAPVFGRHSPDSDVSIDHSSWNDFLARHLVAGEDGVNRVRYGAVSKPDRAALKAYVAKLETIDPATLDRAEQLAFWINLYNAATVLLILDHYPIDSIRDIEDPWDRPAATARGVTLSLDDIEHGIIRPAFRDPRIHYALNCASIGCPNLAAKAYSSGDIDAQLDAAARSYVNHPRGVEVIEGKVVASKLYGWYREDFGDSKAAVLDHIRLYAEPPLRTALEGKRRIDKYRYDWSLNDAP